jgi:pimeloyl-ACP methyl ester carboxylesterase
VRHRIATPAGVTVSYRKYGGGPPLVLVHGSFSDDDSNWEFVKPALEKEFTVYAIARRGRGETGATAGHRLEDEAADTLAVIQTVGEPVFLLGHSYGAHCALLAASMEAVRVRKLVLYEPVWPRLFRREALNSLEALAAQGRWDDFAALFFIDVLSVPAAEIDAVRRSPVWAPIIADAPASLGDMRAVSAYNFQADRFRGLAVPTLLQIGTESPRDLYVTDALAAVLPDARIGALAGQAHEGMTTAPEMYAEAVIRFLLG